MPGTVLQRHDMPPSIRSLITVDRPDYTDVFVVSTGSEPDRSPEEWARAAVEATGLAGQFLWRVVLGLRLKLGPSPDHVGGWGVSGRGDNWLRLEARSWFLTAQIIVRLSDGEVAVGTVLQHDRFVGGLIWPPMSIVHRQVMPRLLRQAFAVVSKRGTA